MPPSTVATPNILSDPGFLWWAPAASSAPTHTVAGSVFTDTLTAPYIQLGATEDGSEFSYETTIEAVNVAEFFDPIRWATTGRQGSFAFNLADFTLNNYKRALNGGITSTVSGTGATLLSKYTPPAPGAEVRSVLLWESLDRTVRFMIYQCIQGGAVTSAFRKAPDKALIPCTFNFEVPASGTPFEIFSAGAARVGTP